MILLHELLLFIQDNKSADLCFSYAFDPNSYFLLLFIIFVGLTKFVMMKFEST